MENMEVIEKIKKIKENKSNEYKEEINSLENKLDINETNKKSKKDLHKDEHALPNMEYIKENNNNNYSEDQVIPSNVTANLVSTNKNIEVKFIHHLNPNLQNFNDILEKSTCSLVDFSKILEEKEHTFFSCILLEYNGLVYNTTAVQLNILIKHDKIFIYKLEKNIKDVIIYV